MPYQMNVLVMFWLAKKVCRYGAVPPKSATAMEYGTASPIARIRVGKISA